MVEVEGKIAKQSIYILIDLGSTQIYISPKIVDICVFDKSKHGKLWLIQIATVTKINVSEMVERYPLEMGVLRTFANMNIWSLGSYDILIGMDW